MISTNININNIKILKYFKILKCSQEITTSYDCRTYTYTSDHHTDTPETNTNNDSSACKLVAVYVSHPAPSITITT